MKTVKRIIQKALNNFGYEIKRKDPWPIYGWLGKEEIKTVLDIGANTGQFALRIHKILPDAQIYSFEPLSDCFEELKRNMRDVPKFRGLNYALGNEAGKQVIYRNDFSDSSSLLPMEQLHKDAFPYTKNAREEVIEIRRLDDIASSLELTKNVLIKIDVQGFEDRVIQGGEQTIKRAKILIVETSFEPLYRGQFLFDGIYSMLKSCGFIFKGYEESLRNPKDGHILQCDSIFVRLDGANR
jgi:FkbM family methyltransferase